MAPALPNNIVAWEKAASNADISRLTIHDLQLDSASKIKHNQYLLLRVLRVVRPRNLFNPKQFGLDTALDQAKGELEHYDAWRSYCHSFVRHKSTENIAPDLGTFSLVRYYQLQVKKVPQNGSNEGPDVIVSPMQTRAQRKKVQEDVSVERAASQMQALQLETPTKKGRTPEISPDFEAESDDEELPIATSPSVGFSPISREAERILYPPTKDEQIINTALILLLNAITIHFPLSNDWTLHRRQFTVDFKTASFQARTDGYLEDRTRDRVRALVEVKPYIRKDTVHMQEAAQMVAWISDDAQRPTQSPGRHFHIAQNRHHIYLIFGEYGENYLRYLKEGITSNDSTSFLTMYEFGPWNIYNQHHMEEFGPIILALTARADRDQQLEYQPSARQGRGVAAEQKVRGLFT